MTEDHKVRCSIHLLGAFFNKQVLNELIPLFCDLSSSLLQLSLLLFIISSNNFIIIHDHIIQAQSLVLLVGSRVVHNLQTGIGIGRILAVHPGVRKRIYDIQREGSLSLLHLLQLVHELLVLLLLHINGAVAHKHGVVLGHVINDLREQTLHSGVHASQRARLQLQLHLRNLHINLQTKLHIDCGSITLQDVSSQIFSQMLLINAKNQSLALLGNAASSLDLHRTSPAVLPRWS